MDLAALDGRLLLRHCSGVAEWELDLAPVVGADEGLLGMDVGRRDRNGRQGAASLVYVWRRVRVNGCWLGRALCYAWRVWGSLFQGIGEEKGRRWTGRRGGEGLDE